MNRREFLHRSLAVAASLGLPAVAATGTPHPATFSFEGKTIYGAAIGCPKCGGDHSRFSAMAVREQARQQLACWWRGELDRLLYRV